jgi:GDP-L-fucose synthase
LKIYVAGHRGLVGSAIVRKIEKEGFHTWVGKNRAELDLFNFEAVLGFIKFEKPDAVIVAAAKVGGIGANAKFPVEFLNDNLRIELNLLEASHSAGVPRLLFLGSSCIYPKYSTQPIEESQLLSGYLEPTNEPYAIAKIAGLKMVEAYSKEYSRDWIAAMPTNIYGPNDNFDTSSGHVLPALIRKFHEAKTSNLSKVTLWGTGTPRREFLHSDDLADACLHLLEVFHSPDHVNIGSGVDVTIRELAQTIRRIVGFNGDIEFDPSMPDGTPRKLLSVNKMRGLGWNSKIALDEGIASTYEWYVNSTETR